MLLKSFSYGSLQLKRRVVSIDSYVDVPAKKEKKLQQAVATQPVSVGICGSDSKFQLYSGVSAHVHFLSYLKSSFD